MCKLPSFMTSLAFLTAMATNTLTANDAAVDVTPWGSLPDGQEVFRYTMTNENGFSVTITNFGARIVNLMVPDKDGNVADVVLGFDQLEDYLKENPYFGAVVGRYGNRICNGQFAIDGQTFHLTKNEKGITCLHGGNVGFDRKIWSVEPITSDNLKHEKIDHDAILGFRALGRGFHDAFETGFVRNRSPWPVFRPDCRHGAGVGENPDFETGNRLGSS
ncbi:MAG: hypothetical protein Q4D98_11905 [Planctomycetia bacterium]|nr:hypothetical protein [Planctomycetia bacterium]